jgi:predicted transcriptional regulator
MREDLSREEVVSVIDRLVEELLGEAGVQGPPVDAVVLAQRHLGMTVCLDRRSPQLAAGRRQIELRPEPTEEQRQWAAAQAIGEHLKPSLLQRLGVEPPQTRATAGLSLAKLFATHLLVPGGWFAADAPAADYDVLQLKERYRTAGHEAVALRLLDLPEPCIVTVVDNGHVHRRRSNAWRVRRELSPAERECQRYVNHYGRPKVVRRGGWTVQGWPVHQADGKREILRSVVEEGEALPEG